MSVSDTERVAKIFTDKKERLNGFKVLGVFPFYLSYIRLPVHIELLMIREKLQEIKGEGSEVNANDFFSASLMKKVTPLIHEYCTTALINNRFLGILLKPFIRRKVKQCGHRQIHGLYTKAMELSDPAFFLDYWTHLMRKDHVVLKTENQSLEKSANIRKSSEEAKKI